MPPEIELVFHGPLFNINTEGKREGFNDATRESLWMSSREQASRLLRVARIQGRSDMEEPDAIEF
jgi:hypothetical protein